MAELVTVPKYYRPRPYQQVCWMRRRSGRYNFYFKVWARQLGKDTDDIENALDYSWRHPGTRTAYIGLDNKWVNENIFNKYIDGRRFWDDFPAEHIMVRDTAKEVTFVNNPENKAEARIKFIGFQNDAALIGSSYDRFVISEASLYGPNAFQFIEPIWENKLANGEDLAVYMNGTPRGVNNVYTKMIQNYTGVMDPLEFPGPHDVRGRYRSFVDVVTIEDAMRWDEDRHEWVRLYTQDDIDAIHDKYIRQGLEELFWQEFYCKFSTVNSGLVYRGIEKLRDEGRYCRFNINDREPVYVAFDISSKGKMTDATAGIVFQFIGGRMMVCDYVEERGQSLAQVVATLAHAEWWKYVRVGFLPWDSERSASSETPIEEVTRMFPSVTWHALDKERVDRGINLVRELMPNMWINSDRCARLNDAFDAYEYKRLEKQDDWSALPIHNWASHGMDALRYAAMGIREMDYLNINSTGRPIEVPTNYEFFGDSTDRVPSKPITYMTEKERREFLHGNGADTYGGF